MTAEWLSDDDKPVSLAIVGEANEITLVRVGPKQTVLTPFRDGIWNRRQVSVCDRVSFPHDPEIVGDRPSWDPGWGRVRSGEASKPSHFRRYVHPTW